MRGTVEPTVVERVEDGEKDKKKNRRRSNRRPKPNNSVSGNHPLGFPSTFLFVFLTVELGGRFILVFFFYVYGGFILCQVIAVSLGLFLFTGIVR